MHKISQPIHVQILLVTSQKKLCAALSGTRIYGTRVHRPVYNTAVPGKVHVPRVLTKKSMKIPSFPAHH